MLPKAMGGGRPIQGDASAHRPGAGGPASLYLGIVPTVTNGIDYWGIDGLEPPRLLIEQVQ